MKFITDYFQQNPLVAYSTPVYILLITLEVVLSNYHRNRYYNLKDSLINLWLNIVNTIIGLAFKVTALAILLFFYRFHFFQIENTIAYWFLLFLLLDFCFYWEHRCEHYSRILWAVHVTHHSSVEFNLSTGFRSSVFRPFVSLWFFLPLVFLGFKPLDILFMDALCQIYGIIVHTRYIHKMPKWFDAVFVSPSHHRVHHASNVLYLDKNMGMVLIVWDRLFKTFQREEEFERVKYGLTKNVEHPYHPTHIIFHEWQALLRDISQKKINPLQRLKYIFYPPGWSHNGSTLTAKEMRKRLFRDQKK